LTPVHGAGREAPGRFPSSGPDRLSDGHVVPETVVHETDIARWLLGEEIVRAPVHPPRSTRHAAAGVRDPLLVGYQTGIGALRLPAQPSAADKDLTDNQGVQQMAEQQLQEFDARQLRNHHRHHFLHRGQIPSGRPV